MSVLNTISISNEVIYSLKINCLCIYLCGITEKDFITVSYYPLNLASCASISLSLIPVDLELSPILPESGIGAPAI